MAVAAQCRDDRAEIHRCLRDLVALAALPAIWIGYDARQIAQSVADVLVRVLGLEFAYVALDSGPDSQHIVTSATGNRRTDQHETISASLRTLLRPPFPLQSLRVPNPVDPGPAYVSVHPIGVAQAGILALASRDAEFPTTVQRILVTVVANQMAVTLQRLRAEEELKKLTDRLEEQVAARTAQLESEIAERERAEAALRQAQKMEAIGHLTGGVAHDVNNLLMIIGGNAELIQQKLGSAELAREIGAIGRAVTQGERLTRQLLAFARQQPHRPSVLNLPAHLPRLVADLIRPSLRGDIVVETDVAEDAWPVSVDAAEFEIALVNLAVNARDAMPNGGSLRLRVYNDTLCGDAANAAGVAGEMVVVSVSDNGVGIAADVLPHVFEPFYTTKEIGRGTGLGLSQVYGFVMQLHGGVRIESRSGAGTTVLLFLPRFAGAVPQSSSEPILPRTDKLNAHVLLVEDNDEVADITAQLLAQAGHSVEHVSTARHALELLQSGADFDLILSDIVMAGGMNGLELARIIRSQFSVAVLLMSGYSSATQAAAAEGFTILPKPFQAQGLEVAVDRALSATGRWRA